MQIKLKQRIELTMDCDDWVVLLHSGPIRRDRYGLRFLRIKVKLECDDWESNPEHNLGKVVLYHLTIVALSVERNLDSL